MSFVAFLSLSLSLSLPIRLSFMITKNFQFSDCWDGPNNEPIVYHGWTLTSKLDFAEVLNDAIKSYAFFASDFPLILSIENHCCKKQQDQVCTALVKIKVLVKAGELPRTVWGPYTVPGQYCSCLTEGFIRSSIRHNLKSKYLFKLPFQIIQMLSLITTTPRL